jgi:hypothetical protein
MKIIYKIIKFVLLIIKPSSINLTWKQVYQTISKEKK